MNTGTLLAERYRIGSVIGRGGMADVYEGHDEVLDRAVAIKVLRVHADTDERFLERFQREARQAAALSHPNIVAVHDAGEHDGVRYIVMELVRGRSLDALLAAEGALPVERGVAICDAVALALAAAHDAGLVHRDVKPGNVLIADNGAIKVADFGIARSLDAQTISRTSVLGTAAYISPEQAQGEDVDARSDVYSLGAVLFEVLAGRAPFQGDGAIQVALQHVAETPPRLRELAPQVPLDLEAIVMKAMAKHPADRYWTAAELHADLQKVLAGEPVGVERAAALLAASGPGIAATPAAAAAAVIATAPFDAAAAAAPTVPAAPAPAGQLRDTDRFGPQGAPALGATQVLQPYDAVGHVGRRRMWPWIAGLLALLLLGGGLVLASTVLQPATVDSARLIRSEGDRA
ncbi:MAG: protein kinase [Actinobacteria bacterium]|nr:protein kinase [Actinomycetota bacterium]